MSKNLHIRIQLVAGLGNPGEEYAKTKHNAGFMAIDKLLGLMPGTFKETKKPWAIFHEGRCRGARLILLKPQTYMNASGEAVARIARKYDIAPAEILLVYDDMDIPLGSIRVRNGGGGSAGHNGVASVMSQLDSAAFARLRIGIGKDHAGNQIDHVLSGFTESDDEEKFARTLETAAEAAKLILYRGTNEAMNKYNSRR